MKGLISVDDLTNDALAGLVQAGVSLPRTQWPRLLEGRLVGLGFLKASTRTRTAFSLALHRMGATAISYGPGDMQLENGESAGDTGLALGLYLDALVLRTNGPEDEFRQLAEHAGEMVIINALSKSEHPTQAIADLITVHQEFGTLSGIHVLYLGAANNTMHSLMLAAAKTPGMRLTILTPPRFAPDAALQELAMQRASESGARLEVHHDLAMLPSDADAVYTARWESMGEEPDVPGWRDDFVGYQVTEAMMEAVGKDSIFLHDMPANRGGEVVDAVMDAPYSRIRRQAFNKAVSAAVVLAHYLK